MATILVENGTGVAGANSYISEADLNTYAADRGKTITGLTNDLLIQAMDYIESQKFLGTKKASDQPLQWPRDGAAIDGFEIGSDDIPQLLKDALCECVLAIDSGTNPLADVPRETVQESVGEISVTYSNNARNTTYLAAVETKLSKLLQGGSRISAAVIRG